MSVSPSKFWTEIYLRLRNATDSCFRDYYYYGKNKEKPTRFSDSCRNISVWVSRLSNLVYKLVVQDSEKLFILGGPKAGLG